MRSRRRDRSRLAIWVAVMVFATVMAVVPPRPPAVGAQANPAVVINEFMAANSTTHADNTGEFSDWIELRNTSGVVVDLGGWTIGDASTTFTFAPGFTIAAGGYRVIIASGSPGRTTAGELHLPFKLSAAGEPLVLRDSTGTVSPPSWVAPGFPPLPVDVSYGNAPGGGLAYFTTPTPGSANTGPSSGLVGAVTFSVPHGFYNSTQTVVLSTATAGATIRYTLDGRTPSATVGTQLTPGQSITVTSTTTLRAIAYRSGWVSSGVETRSYFFTGDIIDQSSTRPPGWPRDGSVNDAEFDYGMDPNVVDGNESTIEASLTSIPTISLVTDLANLVDPSTGILVNPENAGVAWERPVSVELIDPTGSEPGFDIAAGVRIRGGGSRLPENPKHSLRLYFRDEYGDGDLVYPLFGAGGAQSFESVGLATAQHGSWQFRNPLDATWLRDVWSRATQGAMGQPNTDSRFYHLYLNGQYWGLYYTQERVSNGYGVERFGGSEDDYDVITAEWRSAGTATDGTIDDWASLYAPVSDLFVSSSEYAQLSTVVNLENLADYYVLHYFTGDWDGSPMGWQSNGYRFADSNNWRAMRNRSGVGAAGRWIFFDHDSEFTLCGPASAVDVDNTDWNLTRGTVPNHQVPTPAWLHEALLTHPAYRQIVRDRVALHMLTPGGALTAAIGQARFDTLAAAVTGAIDAESARWGDSLGEPPKRRSDWTANVALARQCIADRFAFVQTQLTADGLWPVGDPPVITPAAGALPYGSSVSVSPNGQAGTLWATTDGADPRATNGSPAPTAFVYGGPIVITAATTVKARMLSGSTWTPLAESAYTLSTPAGPVRLALNEYNAVGAGKYLGGGAAGDVANGSDETFGRVPGNGGDWFELVVIDDQLDIRGWTVEIWHLENGLRERSAALVFADAAVLSNLRSGSLITISEDIADDVASYAPVAGRWHMNLQSNDLAEGGFITAASQQNFAIDNDDTQIAIFDAAGVPVALPTGEGTVPDVSVSSEEVFKLEATPTAALRYDSTDYSDGTTSTWGLPNRWAGGAAVQDLSQLRITFGDVNCSGTMSLADALVIAQYVVGTRDGVTTCPVDPVTEAMLPAGDLNGDNLVSLADALLVAQCAVGQTNAACPPPG